MADSRVPKEAGFGRSERFVYTIPSGTNGDSVFRLDLLRPYSFVVVRVEDCAGFNNSGSTISALVALDDLPEQVMATLKETNDPSTTWSKSVPLTGAMQFALTHCFGSRYIKFTTSANTDANVNFHIWGYDPLVIDTDNGY